MINEVKFKCSLFILVIILVNGFFYSCKSIETNKNVEKSIFYCSDCGAESYEESEYCNNCGAKGNWLKENPEIDDEKNNENKDNDEKEINEDENKDKDKLKKINDDSKVEFPSDEVPKYTNPVEPPKNE